jgi:3-oxoacyl-[acyl-carrier protein] reductase
MRSLLLWLGTPLEALPELTVKYMAEKIPMGRSCGLEEAAALIAWIVSPACGFTTGFSIDLSNGQGGYWP